MRTAASGCQSMGSPPEGYMSDVTSHLPYLIAIGFAPVGVMLLLVIVTLLEGSLPSARPRSKG